MKAESINKIVFEELKGTNIIIDIKHNLIDRLKERERKLQSQLKERETIIDMHLITTIVSLAIWLALMMLVS